MLLQHEGHPSAASSRFVPAATCSRFYYSAIGQGFLRTLRSLSARCRKSCGTPLRWLTEMAFGAAASGRVKRGEAWHTKRTAYRLLASGLPLLTPPGRQGRSAPFPFQTSCLVDSRLARVSVAARASCSVLRRARRCGNSGQASACLPLGARLRSTNDDVTSGRSYRSRSFSPTRTADQMHENPENESVLHPSGCEVCVYVSQPYTPMAAPFQCNFY